MTLGEKIKRLRTELDLSLKGLAQESGVKFHTLVGLERKSGRTVIPKITTVIALAEYFDVSIDELLENVRFKK